MGEILNVNERKMKSFRLYRKSTLNFVFFISKSIKSFTDMKYILFTLIGVAMMLSTMAQEKVLTMEEAILGYKLYPQNRNVVWQGEKCTNVREILHFRQIQLLFQ